MADFVKVAEVSDLRPGEVMGVEVAGEAVALVNLDGAFYALADECSHNGMALSEGEVDGNYLICPWHAGSFDVRTGAAVDLPPTAPVRTFRVAVDGEDVLVATGA